MDVETLCKFFCAYLGDEYSYVLKNKIPSICMKKLEADAIIMHDDIPYIIIEHKKKLRKNFCNEIHEVHEIQDRIYIPWSILYFEDEDLIHLRRIKGESEKLSIKDFLDKILKCKDSLPIPSQGDCLDEIKMCIKNSLKQLPQKIKLEKEKLETFCEKLELTDICVKGNDVFFSTEIEYKFFKILLGESLSLFSRYTSSKSLFRILDNGELSMCSLNCMNDPSEIYYADSYIENKNTANKKISKNNVHEGNEIFIMSGCKKNDAGNLLMWRLYAQNAEGICMNMEVQQERLKTAQDFYLFPVCYGGSPNKHHELNIIRDILNLKYKRIKFRFNNWKIWKHFFKSYHYKEEKEVRLLYYKGSSCADRNRHVPIKWIYDDYTGISSPIIIFPKQDFPLKLKNVVLGPRYRESCINEIQLNERVKDTNFKNDVDPVFCTKSKIGIYR